jgi:hypothetical protein
MVLNMTFSDAWLSGFTARWHAGPYAAWLAHTGDTVAAHSGRMAATCREIWGKGGASLDLYEAIACHDLGEAYSGDVPHGAKRDNQNLQDEHEAVEQWYLNKIGMDYRLDRYEAARLRFLDRLDAHEWVRLKAPALLDLPEWRDATAWLEQEAELLGIGDKINVR